MVPITAVADYAAYDRLQERARARSPQRLCDDPDRWDDAWRALKGARRDRLLPEVSERGFFIGDFHGMSWSEMWIEILDDEDLSASGQDDDSGFGPDSYFAHAMSKND